MDRPKLPKRLLATFLGEMEERIGALNHDLLALEQAPDEAGRAGLIKLLFRSAHSLKGAAGAVGMGEIEAACHELEDLFDSLSAGRILLDPGLMQRLFAGTDRLHRMGGQLRADLDGAMPPPPAAAAPVAEREAVPMVPREVAPDGGGSAPTRFARIPVDRLDTLLLRSGELLIARNRATARLAEAARLDETLAQARGLRRGEAQEGEQTAQYLLSRLVKDVDRLVGVLATDSRELDRAAAPLDAAIRDLRLLPFAEACAGLDRAVRDVAVGRGKEVQLKVEGGEVELDRSIVDGLKAPLLHLVRNAADHGIEAPADRQSRGKRRAGTVTVAARHRGASVEISVTDDGAGLDLTAVREQARRRDLAEDDDAHLTHYIFMPRFSTAQTTTEISGRGVGLDAVKSAVEAMRGTIEAASRPGLGMRFTIVLPLALSTVRALLVEAGGQVFALDTANVRQLLRTDAGAVRIVEGRRALALEEGLVPLATLSGILGLRVAPASPDTRMTVALLSVGPRRLALEIDALHGEQETVVRGLGPRLARVRNFMGGTLLPTGRIALILNPASIVQAALGAEGRQAAGPGASAQPPAKRILLADDSVTTRALERGALESAGFAVTTAANGAEAWQMLQDMGADLVISDIDMPVMDGFQLTEAIRASGRFATLPVVLVTARESPGDRERGLTVGANAYVLKSTFDSRVLVDVINELV